MGANVSSSDSSHSAHPIIKRRPEKPDNRKALPPPALGRKSDDLPVPTTLVRPEEKVLATGILGPITSAHCVSSTVPGFRVSVTSAPLRPATRLGSAVRKRPISTTV